MNRGIELKAFKTDPWQGKIELYIYERETHSIVENLEFVKTEDGYMPRPALYIDYTAAQELIDSLWDCGIRPSEGAGSAGAMKAIQDHLQDMRKLVSHLMKTQL